MKKTISINISGFNFHIDEDAYEKLGRYLETIKKHFQGVEGSDEVVGDIEARIAEILQEKLQGGKQVISIEDINEVIGIMGQPSDFAPEDGDPSSWTEHDQVRYQKRLYRDPDHKMIGGVCSGIGAYFNIDPLWVRLLFILLVLAPGFGILLYIILWLVVPEARTKAERLEMRGHPVNVSNLERSIRDEVGGIKDKVNEMAGKAKETYHKQKEAFATSDRSYLKDNLGSIGHFFLRFVGIVTGFIIFLMAASLSFLFLFIVFRFPGVTVAEHIDIGTFPLFPFLGMLFENDADLRTLSIGLVILVAIPLLLLMLAGLRMIFRIPSIRYLNGAAGWVWVLTLIITLFFGLKVAGSFRHEGEINRETVLDIPRTDTLELKSIHNLPADVLWNYKKTYKVNDLGIYLTDHKNRIYGVPKLRISESTDSLIHLEERFYSRGKSRTVALERAEAIDYEWSLDSNILSFPESYTLDPGEKWRRQEVIMELKLPEGCIFRVDNDLPDIMRSPRGTSRWNMRNSILIMTENGVHEFTP